MKRIAILGSTGSIGKQTLEVIRNYPDLFQIEVLTSLNNSDLLIKQALEFKPNSVVIGNEELYSEVKEVLFNYGIKVFSGLKSIEDIVTLDNIDVVVSAIVGYAGLKPTVKSLECGKVVALANKESLVIAGTLITKIALEKKVPIIPIDSEHSAIFQCLAGELSNEIEKIYLTASGGPFFGKTLDELQNISPEEALKHPNWEMGQKITIDSATLMNKGLEVIEAHWLFGVSVEKIEVVIHPQSIIHSFVQFTDGSIKAQLSLPDMRIPIQYALTYPQRLTTSFPRFSFSDYTQFTFYQPDRKTFKCLDLAYYALKKGGNLPCVLNAANEVAVEAFINKKIKFLDIPLVVEYCLEKAEFIPSPNFDDFEYTNYMTRMIAQKKINNM